MNTQDIADAERHQQEEEEQQMSQKIAAALVKARAEISNPTFDQENPFFKSKFASLKACFNAVLPALTSNGIALVQDFEMADGALICRTHLFHESGETLVFLSPPMTPVKSDPQSWASASTFARRYGVMSVGAIVGDVDDDGNVASESAFKSKQAKTKTRNAMLDAAQENDQEALAAATADLDNDQKAELWASFNHDQRRMITEVRKGE